MMAPNILIPKKIPLDVVGGTAFGRYAKISTEETYNMMISDDALVPFAGYQKAVDFVGVGEGRGIHNSPRYQHLICVIGPNVYSVTADLGNALVGELDTSSGDVYLSENNANQIGIVDGLDVYMFNYTAGTLLKAPNIDFLPIYIGWQDGYFMCPDGNTNQWRLSALNNGLSFPFDAQHVGALESKVDVCQAVVPFDRQVFVFGKNTTESWYNVGGQLFPYQRNNYFSIDYGCVNRATIASGFNRVVWLGSNEKSGVALMMSDGGRPVQISNDGINYKLEQIKNPEDSYAFMFKENGHIFYQFTAKSDNLTFCYDFTSQKFYTLTDEKLNSHIAKRVAYFNNTHYFISQEQSDLFELNSNIFTYNGHEIPRIRICKPFRLPDADRFIINEVGLTLEQGDSKEIRRVDISLSKDGGISYGTIRGKDLRMIPFRKNKFRFFRLGSANDARIKFYFWGKDKFVITDGYMEYY